MSKKRKKDGKPVHRVASTADAAEQAERPEEHPNHPQQRAGKPKNPFVASGPKLRGAQRGR